MSRDLLFELGTEDIPPTALPEVALSLRDGVINGLEDKLIGIEGEHVYYTPRRIAIFLHQVDEEQETRTETIRGPAVKDGLDDQGDFTQAAHGFAGSQGADAEDLYSKETAEGNYLFLDKKINGQSTAELLTQILPSAVTAMSLPESMRWGLQLSFIRPIRWMLCLFGSDVVSFTLGGIRAGDKTTGHRFFGDDSIDLNDPGDYETVLKENSVIADPQRRLEYIRGQIEQQADQIDARDAASDGFVEKLSNSVEFPQVFRGQFPADFLELPQKLLFKTLEGEARLIPLVDSEGTTLPQFIGVRDGSDQNLDEIRKGYESVIYARLRDSQFFFNHDRQQSLAHHVQQLKSVTFHKQLGSIWDKVERMRSIANNINDELQLNSPKVVDRTVFLSKADLVTEVVDEFPSLQGEIGSIYAQLDGEPEPVVEGINEHYRPERSGEDPPSSGTGILTSLADKLDTLTGSFLLGERPSGTKDPYGLRRKADGVIRTIISNELNFNLYAILEESVGFYDSIDDKEPVSDLRDYFDDRLDKLLQRQYELPYDVVNAVVAVNSGKLYHTYQKGVALNRVYEQAELRELVESFTRIVNISSPDLNKKFDPGLFNKPAEKELWRQLLKTEARLDDLLGNKQYDQVIEHLIALKEPIDKYFDQVMIMVDEDEVRENRLSFLNKIKALFLQLGDFSEIVVE